jgi:hypothetical protein
MRPGTKAAKAVLAGVMADFYVGLDDLQRPSRTENVCMAKEAFCVRCSALQIQSNAMAEALGVHRTSIYHYSNPAARERRNLNQRRRRAKAEVSAAIMGTWQ